MDQYPNDEAHHIDCWTWYDSVYSTAFLSLFLIAYVYSKLCDTFSIPSHIHAFAWKMKKKRNIKLNIYWNKLNINFLLRCRCFSFSLSSTSSIYLFHVSYNLFWILLLWKFIPFSFIHEMPQSPQICNCHWTKWYLLQSFSVFERFIFDSFSQQKKHQPKTAMNIWKKLNEEMIE